MFSSKRNTTWRVSASLLIFAIIVRIASPATLQQEYTAVEILCLRKPALFTGGVPVQQVCAASRNLFVSSQRHLSASIVGSQHRPIHEASAAYHTSSLRSRDFLGRQISAFVVSLRLTNSHFVGRVRLHLLHELYHGAKTPQPHRRNTFPPRESRILVGKVPSETSRS